MSVSKDYFPSTIFPQVCFGWNEWIKKNLIKENRAHQQKSNLQEINFKYLVLLFRLQTLNIKWISKQRDSESSLENIYKTFNQLILCYKAKNIWIFHLEKNPKPLTLRLKPNCEICIVFFNSKNDLIYTVCILFITNKQQWKQIWDFENERKF